MSIGLGFGLVNQDETKRMVDELCALEEGLTDWEVNFVDSLAKRDPFQCSPKEAEKVQQIANDRL